MNNPEIKNKQKIKLWTGVIVMTLIITLIGIANIKNNWGLEINDSDKKKDNSLSLINDSLASFIEELDQFSFFSEKKDETSEEKIIIVENPQNLSPEKIKQLEEDIFPKKKNAEENNNN